MGTLSRVYPLGTRGEGSSQLAKIWSHPPLSNFKFSTLKQYLHWYVPSSAWGRHRSGPSVKSLWTTENHSPASPYKGKDTCKKTMMVNSLRTYRVMNKNVTYRPILQLFSVQGHSILCSLFCILNKTPNSLWWTRNHSPAFFFYCSISQRI